MPFRNALFIEWVVLAALLAQATLLQMASAEPALSAGKEASVQVVPGGAAMKVFIPANYNDTMTWPVIYFYHGMGGAPDTSWVRRLTEDRDFIVVAMPYFADRSPSGPRLDHGARIKLEQGALQHAWRWLSANARVDESRVFLSGTSKGGWTVSSLWEMDPARFKGVMILLAGRQPGPSPSPAKMRGRPVYIGAGETDPNLLPAMRARQHYLQCGAVVCFDVFEGLGHQTPGAPAKLRNWLRVLGEVKPEEADGPEREGKALIMEIEAALAEHDILKQYRRLQLLSDDPRSGRCDPGVLALARARFAELKQLSPAREEWRAEARLGEMLVLEHQVRSLAEMKNLLEGFQSIVQTYPGTRCGALAADHVPSLEDAYARSLEATRAAVRPPPTVKSGFPSAGQGRGDYPIPEREGKTIKFRR